MNESQMLIAAVVALAGVIVSLAGVVRYLYRRGEEKQDSRYNELKRRVDDCEEDRENLWTELRKLMAGPKTDP